jgi:hypothetical protein
MMKKKIQNWIWLKLMVIRFNYYNNILNKYKNLFNYYELDMLRTSKNSFDFFLFRAKNKMRIEQEFNKFKNIICYRLYQSKKKNPLFS